MKSILLAFFIFVFFVEAAYLQGTTPLVAPAQTLYRPKKDPKGGCVLTRGTPLDFDVKLDFPIVDGKVVTEIVSSTRYDRLIFETLGGKLVAKLNYFVRFAAARDRRVVGFIETTPRVILNEIEIGQLKTQSLLIRDLIDVPPGSYIADIFLRDVSSDCRGVQTLRFTIP
ncbi:MAG: hypothetical protein IPM25_02295 [Chloracidobacterium sp.]|nr:hypothetical protein [Chloracidobacterium sp.]